MKSSNAGWNARGIFEMTQLIILVKHQLSDLNLDGNLIKGMYFGNVFKSDRKMTFFWWNNDTTQSNLSGEEWKALRNLADDRTIKV